jgi:predicted dehydrogenase
VFASDALILYDPSFAITSAALRGVIMNRQRLSRRSFNRALLAGAASALASPAVLRGQNLNGKLNIAMIACGRRGAANLKSVSSENIVALCDVDARSLESAAAQYPRASKFTDFRKLFDRPEAFDAVVVSTCEHTHAFATMLALKNGKHVYCEKPLTHNIWEARQIRLAAAQAKVATQMGIQIHAGENMRQVVELIWSGAIGPVREAHVWVSRAWGLQSEEAAKRNKDVFYVTERPKEGMPVPPYLDWDLWLGPREYRPFHEVYFPGPRWYRWWDFGSGTMSDLGSHWNDFAFWALKLQSPLTIQAAGPDPHPDLAPASMNATYEYGQRGDMPAVKVTWYQGESKPENWKAGQIPKWGDGVLFIGDKGMLLSNYSKHVLLPEKEFADFVRPSPTLPRSPGHHEEWIAAAKAGKKCSADFEYGGSLTEANHLGNVAFRTGKQIEWDAENLRAKNAPEADQLIRREYRKGWTL